MKADVIYRLAGGGAGDGVPGQPWPRLPVPPSPDGGPKVCA